MTVSVVIPTKNRGEMLLAAVRSALAADEVDEVVLVDAGSEDGSLKRAAALGDVRVVEGPFSNAAATRNAGLQAATGEHIAFLDSDDLMHRRKITCLAPLLRADARVALAHGTTRVIDASGAVNERATVIQNRAIGDAAQFGTTYAALARRCVMFTSATLMRRAAIEAVGGYDETLDAYEDWDLYLRLSLEWQLLYAVCPAADYRVWPGNVAWRRTAEWTIRVADRHLAGLMEIPATERRAAKYGLLRRIAMSSAILVERGAARRAALAAFRTEPATAMRDGDVLRPLAGSFLPKRVLNARRGSVQ